MNCTERNGVITGYSVQYSIVGGTESPTVTIVGADVTSTDIIGLTKSMLYEFSVAAINGWGRGPHSSQIVTSIRMYYTV